jgi:sulfite exporter TauE/SafE
MNSKSYTVIGWIVWQVGSRLAKRRMAQNRAKLGAAGLVVLVVLGGAFAARSSGEED